MFNIRKAKKEDTDEIIHLYKEVINQIKDYESNPGWIFGKYPKEEHIANLIKLNEVFIGIIDDEIVSSVVVNHTPNKGDDEIDWKIKTDLKDIYYIHLVAVNRKHKGKGIATKMIKYISNEAKENNIKSIRLNLNKTNIKIEKLYLNLGFEYVASNTVFIEERGNISFNIYEKVINSN